MTSMFYKIAWATSVYLLREPLIGLVRKSQNYNPYNSKESFPAQNVNWQPQNSYGEKKNYKFCPKSNCTSSACKYWYLEVTFLFGDLKMLDSDKFA